MNLIFLTILIPIISFLLLITLPKKNLSKNIASLIGVGSIFLSSILSIYIVLIFYIESNNNHLRSFNQIIYNWIVIDSIKIPIAIFVDKLSSTMLLLISNIGFFISLYATWYMKNNKNYAQFFAYINLFIANMLILVLADNLLLMYLGWECVGFCSYMLIGFYHNEIYNCIASIKSLIFTRIGDIFIILALFIAYTKFGTVDFININSLLKNNYFDPITLNLLALTILLGSIGKSAQLPLQNWLADAMVGPTPVSALIHSSTMVTAGIYLIIRMNDLFILTNKISYLISIIGSATLILAGCSALVQNNIKRILAYSTISQLGYIFVALGAHLWNEAIYHMIIHSFFKSLLFLTAGSIIKSCNDEHNIFKMNFSFKHTPLLYVCYFVGGLSLSALPMSSGFSSKEEILLGLFINKYLIFAVIGLIGSLLTTMYVFRMIFIIFHNRIEIIHSNNYRLNYYIPMIVFLILSTFLGSCFIKKLFINKSDTNELYIEYKIFVEILSIIISTLGVIISFLCWYKKHRLFKLIYSSKLGKYISNYWFNGWGFNFLYELIIIKPYLFIVYCISNNSFNIILKNLSSSIKYIINIISFANNGNLRWYIISIEIGILASYGILNINF